ncbi:probable RNA methyltransferase CG1239 [Condylostylus longicornis]|uniref:probable RNA methyltransferase CG1239 n=1 Tax=Condylostylus longicornis TaxID=2530218 RepID=UPI00244E3833|nr:probable RNA methyltransferase CG1239 [Condylostylus longicornis]XP_055377583.1 probable RNA methyltransferase CG1239 [Condylostylus longicornis]
MDLPLIKNIKEDFLEETVISHIKTVGYESKYIENNNCGKGAKIFNEKSSSNAKVIHNNPYQINDAFKNKSFSPKKKLECTNHIKTKNIFEYGNYSRYYGYRNAKNFQDIRLEAFSKYKNLFEGKEVLDIGCNSGLITMQIAEDHQKFNVKHIVGLDIDKKLINRAIKIIEKKRRNTKNKAEDKSKFPFNIKFVFGNYVLKDDILLEIEKQQFDLILCLSVTKWIHLNFGDEGLKQAFRRMYLQIRPGGCLILEPQPWSSYNRRKNLTPEIHEKYKNITFFPEKFVDYLTGPEVKFSEFSTINIPEHPSKGFRRPLQLFFKK